MAEAGGKKPTCFVVMGFGEKTDYKTSRVLNLDKTYKYIIKVAVEAAGLTCLRADEIPHAGTIDAPMYEQLFEADLVIADLSASNVNAAYELGIRHALRPRTTIVIAEDQFLAPFDVNHIVIRKYRHDGKALDIEEAERFRNELSGAIQQIMATERIDSPVYTFLPPLVPPTQRVAKAAAELAAKALAAVASAASVARVASAPTDERTLSALMEQVNQAKDKKDFLSAKALLKLAQTIAPSSTFVVQQLALVTYKSKQPTERDALAEARGVLSALDPEHSNNAETLGIWGAIHKRLFELTQERALLDTAIFAYEKGYRLLGDYYNGVNWAFLLDVRAALSERGDAIADLVLARRARSDVTNVCLGRLKALKEVGDAGERYWLNATLAECAVGLDDEVAAAEYMKQALQVASEAWMADSTNEQLAKLRACLARVPAELKAWLVPVR